MCIGVSPEVCHINLEAKPKFVNKVGLPNTGTLVCLTLPHWHTGLPSTGTGNQFAIILQIARQILIIAVIL